MPITQFLGEEEPAHDVENLESATALNYDTASTHVGEGGVRAIWHQPDSESVYIVACQMEGVSVFTQQVDVITREVVDEM